MTSKQIKKVIKAYKVCNIAKVRPSSRVILVVTMGMMMAGRSGVTGGGVAVTQCSYTLPSTPRH